MSNNKVVKFLSREAFQKPPELKFEDVLMPEFGEGCGVRILELDAEAAQAFGERVSKEEDKKAMPLWIIASARAVEQKTENGEPVFEDEEKTIPVLVTGAPIFEDSPASITTILSMGASVVMRLGNTALRLNGFTKDETDKETKN
jgi:hypothetical protein